jgi:hypothetical protein
MTEHYLKLLYITKHNVNMSHSSDTWRRKNRESLRTSTQISLSIYIILNSNRVALLHILLYLTF